MEGHAVDLVGPEKVFDHVGGTCGFFIQGGPFHHQPTFRFTHGNGGQGFQQLAQDAQELFQGLFHHGVIG